MGVSFLLPYQNDVNIFVLTVLLLFWLFGSHFMMLAASYVVYVLYRLDRTPKILADANSNRANDRELC